MHAYFVRFVRSLPNTGRSHINYVMESTSRESLRRRVKELAKSNGAYEIAIYTESGRTKGEHPVEEWVLGENRWKRIR